MVPKRTLKWSSRPHPTTSPCCIRSLDFRANAHLSFNFYATPHLIFFCCYLVSLLYPSLDGQERPPCVPLIDVASRYLGRSSRCERLETWYCVQYLCSCSRFLSRLSWLSAVISSEDSAHRWLRVTCMPRVGFVVPGRHLLRRRTLSQLSPDWFFLVVAFGGVRAQALAEGWPWLSTRSLTGLYNSTLLIDSVEILAQRS